MEIIPAIIPKNFDDLKTKISFVKGMTNYVQIDITDGIFVSSKSWPFSDEMWSLGIHLTLPCEECNLEFDLMINRPEEKIQNWLEIGAKRIVIHVESTNNLEKIIGELKGKVEIGLAFNINTSFELFDNLLNKVDFIQLMGIEKIGFQGEQFSEKVFEKIKELKIKKPDIIISVDGGVNLENAQRLIEAGVSRLVIGSAIFESGDIERIIRKFKELS